MFYFWIFSPLFCFERICWAKIRRIYFMLPISSVWLASINEKMKFIQLCFYDYKRQLKNSNLAIDENKAIK